MLDDGIPQRSEDLIKELLDAYKPKSVSAADLATETGRVNLALEQGKIDLVQSLKRRLDERPEK